MVEKRRYKDTGEQSFFGDYIYERVVPEDHFLRKLKELIDWERFTQKLIDLYKGEGVVGRPPFDPAQLLRIMLIAYLYNLSEREVEVFVNENLPAKYFVGLGVDQRCADHSTLSVFKKRLLKRGKLQIFEEMLSEIIQMATRQGVHFGTVQVIDSVHTTANMNTQKNRKRHKGGKGPRDPDAQWGVKHQRQVKNEKGEDVKQTEYFLGYKMHTSMNAENGLITSLEVTPGNAYDGHHFCSLVDHDLEQNLVVETYTADRGYDDGNNHYYLEVRHLNSAIRLRDIRTKKKDKNKQPWEELSAMPEYQEGLKQRYKIERKFGEAKQNHGLGRCRYLGLLGYIVQAYFTAMVLDLKRIVKILTGIGFKTNSTVTM
jgi:IS5 family transposase